jgi:hypothetical protein
MKKSNSKSPENELLDVLQNVLPKTTKDLRLAGRIMKAVEKELRAKEQEKDFQKFCKKTAVPDLQAKTVKDLEKVMAANYADAEVLVKPMNADEVMAVEISLPDGSQYYGELKVDPEAPPLDDPDAQEFKPKFIAFPVAMPGDPENVWLLAKREDLSNEEAGRALEELHGEYWDSKSGQNALRKGAERCFPEFIDRVAGGPLREKGLKRHYKQPEAVKVLKLRSSK